MCLFSSRNYIYRKSAKFYRCFAPVFCWMLYFQILHEIFITSCAITFCLRSIHSTSYYISPNYSIWFLKFRVTETLVQRNILVPKDEKFRKVWRFFPEGCLSCHKLKAFRQRIGSCIEGINLATNLPRPVRIFAKD